MMCFEQGGFYYWFSLHITIGDILSYVITNNITNFTFSIGVNNLGVNCIGAIASKMSLCSGSSNQGNLARMAEFPAKQLSMAVGAAAIRRLRDVPLPPDYVLRTYRPGDEASWAELNVAAGFKDWDKSKVAAYLEDATRRAGSHLVDYRGQAVAATFSSRQAGQELVGTLDYVVCHPDHQNQKLGRSVCTGVLRFWEKEGYERVDLLTDDWRLPAIKLYHNLGFAPVMNRGDMPQRWRVIYTALGLSANSVA
jgi:mycothiol synthase